MRTLTLKLKRALCAQIQTELNIQGHLEGEPSNAMQWTESECNAVLAWYFANELLETLCD